MQHGKETEMPGKCRSVLCCLDEHLLRQIDGKFGSQIKRYYQTPLVVIIRSVIPWFITWSYLFKSWIIFGALRVLLSKFRKSLEVKISLESFNAGRFLSMVEGLLQHQFVRKSNLGLNLYWSIHTTKTKGPPQNCLRLDDRAKCCQKAEPVSFKISKMEVSPENQISKSNENQSWKSGMKSPLPLLSKSLILKNEG